jgi:hypothetical protein
VSSTASAPAWRSWAAAENAVVKVQTAIACSFVHCSPYATRNPRINIRYLLDTGLSLNRVQMFAVNLSSRPPVIDAIESLSVTSLRFCKKFRLQSSNPLWLRPTAPIGEISGPLESRANYDFSPTSEKW